MHPLLVYSFAVLIPLSTQSFADANEHLCGFSIDLIHRDSPLSPFYSVHKSFESNLIAAEYTYLVRLKVGTVETLAIPDTGSDLIWLNGKGCTGNACEHQTANFTIIQPDPECKPRCLISENTCEYNFTYSDNFTTQGKLTTDRFWFPVSGVDGKEESFSVCFGVSNHSVGNIESRSAGIVGLGRGKLSLISQLSERGRFDFKFSYCLPPNGSNTPSKLKFGNEVAISDDKSTSLLTDNCEDRYCVHLENIYLNGDTNQAIPVSDKIFIDSGSTFTSLSHTLFGQFIDYVKKEIGEEHSTPLDTYSHCFKQENGKKLEKLSFQFEGTQLHLKQRNFFDEKIHDNTNYLCLTVMDGNTTRNILGSRAQVDFKVVFDMIKMKVSFDEDCGKQNVELSDFVFQE